MPNVLRRFLKASAFGATLLLCGAMSGCPASTFALDSESRLPKWFDLSLNRNRSDVRVVLNYYDMTLQSGDAELVLEDLEGNRLARVSGQHCWHPFMATLRNGLGGLVSDSYPHYVIFRAGDSWEVIEHPGGPRFRISDDPNLVQQASTATGCAKAP